MSASSFSSLTKDLNKSRSLLQAGRSIVDSTPCSSFDGGIDTASVGGDADVVSLEDEFAELAKWCSQQPGQSVVEGIPTVKAKEIVNVLEKEENPKEDDEDGSIQPILISSVGTVKQRYRSLQREEEKKEAKKASRLKRNFTEEAKEPVSCISEADEEVAPNTPVVQYDVVLENLSYSKVHRRPMNRNCVLFLTTSLCCSVLYRLPI